MPYRFLCNGVKREGVKASPILASGFSALYCYTKIGMASVFRREFNAPHGAHTHSSQLQEVDHM
jgi:hypothetical protein